MAGEELGMGLSLQVTAPLACGPSDPPMSPQNSSAPLAEDMDPEVSPHPHTPARGASPRCSLVLRSDLLSPVQLARYLNRNYWEKKQEEARKSPTPSAPVPLTEPAAQPGEGHPAPVNVVEVRRPLSASAPKSPGRGRGAKPAPLTLWSLPDAPSGHRLSAHHFLQWPL